MTRAAALIAVALACGVCAAGAQSQRPAGRYLVYTRAVGSATSTVWIGDVEGRRMNADGRNKEPLMRMLPKRFGVNGYYGIRPYAWVQGRRLMLATIPTEWGAELALVDIRDGRAWKPDLDPRPRYARPMYVDDASSDGRHVVGAACGANGPCTIRIYSVLDGRRHVITGDAAYPDWNR